MRSIEHDHISALTQGDRPEVAARTAFTATSKRHTIVSIASDIDHHYLHPGPRTPQKSY